MDKPVVVIVESEHGELTLASLECVEEGRDVADRLNVKVQAVLCGSEVEPLAGTLAAHGADQVTVVKHEALAHFSADGWLQALAPVLLQAHPALLLAPDSGSVRAWLPPARGTLAIAAGWLLYAHQHRGRRLPGSDSSHLRRRLPGTAHLALRYADLRDAHTRCAWNQCAPGRTHC